MKHANTLRHPRARSGRRGFTFLEIMLVVMIIGLLAAVVGPRIVGQGDKARQKTTALAINGLSQALRLYEQDTGGFPTTQQGLQALLKRPSDVAEDQWDGPYLESDAIPKDGWSREFKYRCPPEKGTYFDLYSLGLDKVENTADDVTNWVKDAK
jgi:general secretion pathway protein G